MKYIDAEKLIERLEEMKQAEYENCGGVNSKTGALYEVQELITSLQQEQPDKVSVLTWKDINDIERIINNVHYEFRNGINEESFGKLVLERFLEGMDESNEQEQPEVDLDAEITKENEKWTCYEEFGFGSKYDARPFDGRDIDRIARHFYELGLNARKV